MNEPILLGIDGGGTSTTAWLADAQGEVLGRGRAGPSNAKAVGTTAAAEALGVAIGSAFRDAGLEGREVEVACLGLAGFDRPDDRKMLEGWSEGSHWARRLVLVNDGELVIAAGTPDGWGVGVIAGTGSIAVARAPDGRTSRAGGWGHLIGDEGSAYAVALAGLRLVARRVDGREALRVLKAKDLDRDIRPVGGGPLADRLCRALGVADPREIVSVLYAGDYDRTRIAGLAPAVVAAAADDPEVLGWVLEPAGYELGQAALAAARALDWSEPTLPLAMAGGFLLASPMVEEALLGYLRRFADGTVIPARVEEPVRGAIALARRALGG